MRRARPPLGTIVEIAAEGADDVLPAAIEEAFASIEQVQRLMNFYDPDSEVSQINEAKAGQGIIVDPQTLRVLHFAHRLSDISGGLFDVTTASIRRELPRSSVAAR
jgi:FAD:protein FMN transferase